MNLTSAQKAQVLNKVEEFINKRFYNPLADLDAWKTAWTAERSSIEMSNSAQEFQDRVSNVLAKLKSSHVAFFRADGRGVAAPYALNATFLKTDSPQSTWIFLDVLEGGVAHKAGIVMGESLVAMNGRSVAPPEMPRFDLASSNELTIEGREGTKRTVPLVLPQPTDKGRPPLSEIRTVTSRKLSDSIGYVRVAYFPGAVGDRFTVEYERALAALGSVERLVIDLRGNVGGGLGSLRVMSSLCADSQPVGYNITRQAADRGLRKDQLARIDRIPMSTAAKLKMFVRFKFLHRDRSIALFTEGLGARSYHGRTTILINEHTKSAAEMVAAFAKTNGFATLIGTRTAGEVLGAVNFVVGEGYRLRIPIGGWMTWDDRLLEGSGVEPDIEVKPQPVDLRSGEDVVLGASILH